MRTDYPTPCTLSGPRDASPGSLLNACLPFLRQGKPCVSRKVRRLPAPSLSTRVSVCLAVLFLFSVLTPEPGYVQGYEGGAFPTFVESDAAFALCSSPTLALDRHPCLAYLQLVPEVFSWVTVNRSSHSYRGPPLPFLLP